MVLRPARHPGDETGEFEDPLSQYGPPVYADDMEQALCEDRVTDMQATPFSTIRPDTTVLEAIRVMVDQGIACVMVADGERLLGLFTERDVLNKVFDRFDQVKHLPVSLVMTHAPAAVYDKDPPASAINLMAVAGFRHVPILGLDGRVAGIVGPRRVIAYLARFLFPAAG